MVMQTFCSGDLASEARRDKAPPEVEAEGGSGERFVERVVG